MNVSEIAREVGIAPTAVRFYERKGILPAAGRRANGYRSFGEEDLCRLRVVVSLRKLGLELDVAGRLADLCATGHCDEMSRDLEPLIGKQRAAVARARSDLEALDERLALLQVTLAAGEPRAEECATKGGECDDELRLRPVLPVSTDLPLTSP